MKSIFAALKTTPSGEGKVYLSGLGLILVSLLAYLFSFEEGRSSDLFTGVFFFNYTLCILYAIVLIIYKVQQSRPRTNISHRVWINLVILITISAFSLNASMKLFAAFPVWLNVYTILSCLSFLLFPYINQLHAWVKSLIYFVAGLALVLAVYMLIFLSPLIPLSIIAIWFFGLTVHSFVPALWIWVLVDTLFLKNHGSRLKAWVLPGIALPLLVLGVYLYKWNKIQSLINEVIAEKNINSSQSLPDAIVLAQKLPSDPLSEQIIISPMKSQRFWNSGFGLNFGGEKKFHDPLSIIAMEMFGSTKLDHETVKTFLEIRHDYRHKTSRRLWSGTSLSTGSISNNIEVFPEYRIAYQEKILTIHNDLLKNDRDFWFRSETQEAVYTFHLPEGSIVTSLSLWINGVEEKSRLTTRKKADSAYVTIVGVERRDPALVHWQEGNRISVTVFPCTPEENRTFKIGFTTPLVVRDNKLWLENVWFEGPDINDASEVTQVAIRGTGVNATDVPDGFDLDAKNNYMYKGEYNPSWKMGFAKVPLSKADFSFNGNKYSLKELQNKIVQTDYEEIYLDVMKDWEKDEYDAIVKNLPTKKLYVWLPERVKITEDNKEKVWEELSSYQYSLPFLYNVKNPGKSVVLTKSGQRSPLLSDLKESDYAERTTAYLGKDYEKIKVINFGEELSPFWKCLHELRLVEYAKADLSSALHQISKNEYHTYEENASTLAIVDSKMSIVKQPTSDTGKAGIAPDHLLRMFAYNDVMRKIGPHYFNSQDYEESVFAEAEEGYVVTPVTSMIVLESEEDYKRMGIDNNKNTVGNSGIIGGGAVPEPHEWVLIFIVVIVIMRQLYITYKDKLFIFLNR